MKIPAVDLWMTSDPNMAVRSVGGAAWSPQRPRPAATSAVTCRVIFRKNEHGGADGGSGPDPGPARVPGDQRGRSSGGELENDEHTAGVVMQMVRTASRFRLPGAAELPFKRMSVVLEDFVLAVTVSGQKVFVVKRQHAHPEHALA